MDSELIIEQQFDKSFCAILEYHLTSAFGNSSENRIKYFWCDGIETPFDNYKLSNENFLASRKIITEAWIGATGQDKYKVTIKLGRKSIDGVDLIDCLPGKDSLDWITIDIEGRAIELRLK